MVSEMTEILDLKSAVAAVLPGVRADLEALVRIPSVGADPARHDEVRRSAEATATLFRDAGLDTQIVEVAGGLPAVIARSAAPPGRPTVLLYAHHDVQPEGNRADWDSEPFEPTERDGRLYGRGAADDKAGIAAHLAAIRAHGDELPVGVTVFVEGEEENGSESLPAILEEHRDLLANDVMVIADSTNWDIGVPALTTSLRGLAGCVVEVRTLHHGVHSGMWGGVAPDALTTLIRLLATLHDHEGNVAVKGVVSGSATDLVYAEDRFRAEAGVIDGVELIGTGSVVDRLWAKPAIAIIAVDATQVADASNTLIPVARAKISMRIAPGDVASRALDHLQEHLRAHTPYGAQVTFSDHDLGEPFAVDASGPAYDAARAAFKEAWDGTEPVDIGVGGSIPFIAELATMFPHAAILVTGVEDPDTRAHGANEGLHLSEFERVCLAEALLLQKLADVSATPATSATSASDPSARAADSEPASSST
jgi:acetylornithine deacetylase/succinyl-diaminopimelate desuccinylase-like protein